MAVPTNEYTVRFPLETVSVAFAPPACRLMPVSVSENKSPADGPPDTPNCRPIENPPTPTEPRPLTEKLVAPPLTEKVCAVTLAGPPANDQSVTTDGL